jgi:uncharacterized protein
MASKAKRQRRIVLAGGSGQVGQALARHFVAAGEHVIVLSRRPAKQPAAWNTVVWDGATEGAWTEVLDGCDVCINLTGRSVNCRYNEKNRAEIYNSRVDSTRLVGRVIASASHPPRVWLNASTATIYRHSLDRPMDEFTGEYGGNEAGAPDTWNFSITVAKGWEQDFFDAPTNHTRKVALRSAMVMGAGHGGVFDVLSTLARRGLGGTIGSGTQYMSWIHEADFARAVDRLIEDGTFEGAVNLASPCPLPNREFMRELRQAWGVRFGLPAAEWMIEIGTFLMRTESELVLKSRWVIPGRLQRAGFHFQFPDWRTAAADLVRQMRA